MEEFPRLVVQHFATEMERALRDAFREVVGANLPEKFTLDLAGDTIERSKPTSPPSVESSTSGGSASLLEAKKILACKRHSRRGRSLRGASRSKAKSQAS